MTPGNGDRDFEAGLLEELGDVDPELLDRYREIQAEEERTGDGAPAAVAGDDGGEEPATVAALAVDDAPPVDRAEPEPAAALSDVEELLSGPLPVVDVTAVAVPDGPVGGAEPEAPVGPADNVEGNGETEPVSAEAGTGRGSGAAPEDDGDAAAQALPGVAVDRVVAADRSGRGDDVEPEPRDEGLEETAEGQVAPAGGPAEGDAAADRPEQGDDGEAAAGEGARGEEEAEPEDGGDDVPAAGDGEQEDTDDGAAGPEAGEGDPEPAVPARGLVARVLDHEEAFNREVVTWLKGAALLDRALAERGLDDARLDEEIGTGGRFLLEAWFALNGVRAFAEVWEHWMLHARQAMGDRRRHWSGRVVELLEIADVELGEALCVDAGEAGWREALREALPAAELENFRKRVREHAGGETDLVDVGLSVIDNLVDAYVGKERQERDAKEVRRLRSELDAVKLDPTWRVAANYQMVREPGLAALFRRCAGLAGVRIEVPAVPAGRRWVNAEEQPFVWMAEPGREVPVGGLPAAVVVLGREAWEARAQQQRGRGAGVRPPAAGAGPALQAETGVVLARVERIAFQAREPGAGVGNPVAVEDEAAAQAAVAKGMVVEFVVWPLDGMAWLRPAEGPPEAVLPAARAALGVERMTGVVMVAGAEAQGDLVDWYVRTAKDLVWAPVVTGSGGDMEGEALGRAVERVSGYDGMGMAGGGTDRR